MSLQHLASQVAAQGRGNDTELVHMSTREVAGLQALAAQHGMQLPRNPHTGLVEANFLDSILPAIAGIALTAVAPEAMLALGSTFGGGAGLGAGLAVGAADTLATGSIKKGLMAGLGAYGGSNIGSALSAAGTPATITSTVPGISAAPTVGANVGNASTFGFGNEDLSSLGIPTTTVPTTTAAIPATPELGTSGLQNASNVLRTAQGISPATTGDFGFGSGDMSNIVPSSTVPTTANAVTPTTYSPTPTSTTLSGMAKGLGSLTDQAGRSAFMSSLGTAGPFSTPGYNQMFNAGAVAMGPMFDTSASIPNTAERNLQNTIRPYAFNQTPTAAPGMPGSASTPYFNQTWTAMPTYVAAAGGGLMKGSSSGEGLHRTVGQMRGVEHLMKYSSGGISNL